MKTGPTLSGRKYDYDAVYRYIVSYKKAHDGNSPSLRDLMLMFGMPSTSIANHILKVLEQEGKIKVTGIRSIMVIGGHWSMV